MKVWLVYSMNNHDARCDELRAIFSTQELAEQYIENVVFDPRNHYVLEVKVDQ